MRPGHAKLLTGAFFLLMGLMIVLAAFDTGPMAGSARHAPDWIIILAGLFFIACGGLLVFPSHRLAVFLGGLATLGFTTVSAWIALFGEDQYFSGGLSLFSRQTDIVIARILFGSVAVLGVAITINALRSLLGKK